MSGCDEPAESETPEQFSVRVLETAIKDWDAEEMYAMASEQFRSEAALEDVQKMFTHYSVLGELKSHEPPVGQIINETLPDGTMGEFGTYQINAVFDKDDVKVGIVTIRTDKGWKLYGFNISSNYVMSMIQAAKQKLKETREAPDGPGRGDDAAD